MQKFLDKKIVSVVTVTHEWKDVLTDIIFNFDDNSAIKLSADFIEECYLSFINVSEIKPCIPISPAPEGKVTMYYPKGE